jgi:hypothetical protein
MLDNGYTKEFADRTFRQLEGFGSYGFPESHAASFALIAYASASAALSHLATSASSAGKADGRDRSPGPDPGRHGASLYPSA